ncbi:MAG: VOC family protein [Candidatus Hodarchaeales archaeon]|jgi:catechol 2,3-dioxygenase-like lactoylglutathione lyase family enzyme
MKTSLYHIQINASDYKKSTNFYKELLGYFEYKVIYEDEYALGISDGSIDFWIMSTESKYRSKPFHRKTPGINHIAFKVTSKEEIDIFTEEFLKPKKIVPLYETPHHFPEYTKQYYAVYFEDPDKIKLEVAYT